MAALDFITNPEGLRDAAKYAPMGPLAPAAYAGERGAEAVIGQFTGGSGGGGGGGGGSSSSGDNGGSSSSSGGQSRGGNVGSGNRVPTGANNPFNWTAKGGDIVGPPSSHISEDGTSPSLDNWMDDQGLNLNPSGDTRLDPTDASYTADPSTDEGAQQQETNTFPMLRNFAKADQLSADTVRTILADEGRSNVDDNDPVQDPPSPAPDYPGQNGSAGTAPTGTTPQSGTGGTGGGGYVGGGGTGYGGGQTTSSGGGTSLMTLAIYGLGAAGALAIAYYIYQEVA